MLGWGQGEHLTKGQPAQSCTKLGHEMSLHMEAGKQEGAQEVGG